MPIFFVQKILFMPVHVVIFHGFLIDEKIKRKVLICILS